MASTASFGISTTNGTNTAGNVIYAHGNISASGATMAATASFGTPTTVTTNLSGTPLYVHGNASGSDAIMFATAAFGASSSVATNPVIGGTQTVLYAHGIISASNDIIAHNYTASGHYNLVATTATASGSIFQGGDRLLHTKGGSLFLGKNAGNFSMTVATNTGIGEEALNDVSSEIGHNTAVGYLAGDKITDSNYNTVVGSNAMGIATANADGNTIIGYSSGINITAGNYNVLMGYQAADRLAATNYNIGIGYQVFTGSVGSDDIKECIALGKHAGYFNTTSSKIHLGNHYYGAVDGGLSHHLVEGEMDLQGDNRGNGRATIHQILRIMPTGSNAVSDDTVNTGTYYRPGDIMVSGSGVEGTVHNLMFYNGVTWKKIV